MNADAAAETPMPISPLDEAPRDDDRATHPLGPLLGRGNVSPRFLAGAAATTALLGSIALLVQATVATIPSVLGAADAALTLLGLLMALVLRPFAPLLPSSAPIDDAAPPPRSSRLARITTGCGVVVTLILTVLSALQLTPSVWTPFANKLASHLGGVAPTALVSALSAPASAWTATTLWLAALAVATVSLVGYALYQRRSSTWVVSSSVRVDAALAAGVFLAALAFRLPNLTTLLPFVHGDEAECGLFARQFVSGQAPLLSISWYGLPMFSYAFAGLGLQIFGDTLTGLRSIDVVLGATGVTLTFLLGRLILGRRAGLIAALILAVTFLHIDLSRDGIHYMQGPTLITLTLLLVVWRQRGGPVAAAFFAGVALIFTLQVYWSARVAPFLVFGLLLYLLVLDRRSFLARWRGLLALASGVFVAGLPVLALFAANPDSFNGHQGEVSLLSQMNVSLFAHQAWTILSSFGGQGDASLQIGWQGAMLDTVSAALLPAALLFALFHLHKWPYALLLAWFGIVAAAGIVTINPPWYPRLAALLPAVALLLAVLVDAAATLFTRALSVRSSWMRWSTLAPVGLSILLLGGITIGNARVAFDEYPAAAQLQSPMNNPTLLGQFLASAPDAAHTVLLSDGSYDLGYGTVQFLAPASGGCTLQPAQTLADCPLAHTSHLFVVQPGRFNDVATVEKKYPGGKVVSIGAINNTPRLIAYELPFIQRASSQIAVRRYVWGSW